MRGALVASLGLLFALTACGVPVSAGPQRLPAQDGVGGTTVPIASGHNKLTIYFLKNGRLTPEVERVKVTSGADALAALQTLDVGPTLPMLGQGVVTALNEDPAQLSIAQLQNNLATIAVDSTFTELFGTTLYEAEAQIVWTLTSPGNNVTSVQFTLGGGVLPAYLPSGQLATGPVTRGDYCTSALVPLGQTCHAPYGTR